MRKIRDREAGQVPQRKIDDELKIESALGRSSLGSSTLGSGESGGARSRQHLRPHALTGEHSGHNGLDPQSRLSSRIESCPLECGRLGHKGRGGGHGQG